MNHRLHGCTQTPGRCDAGARSTCSRRGAAFQALVLPLAALLGLLGAPGCGSLPVSAMSGPRCAAVLEVALELAGGAGLAGGRGRLWLRLMPQDTGVAEESVLEWWREQDGTIALRPEAPGSRPATAVFAPLHPARWRLSSFVLLGRVVPEAGGVPRTLSVAGRFDDTDGVALGDGEAGLLGRLTLRAGIDRTFVYAVAPPAADPAATAAGLGAAEGLRPVRRPLVEGQAPPPSASSGEGDTSAPASTSEAPVRDATTRPGTSPRVTEAGRSAPALGPDSGAPTAPGDAVLGLAMRMERPLAEGERAEGILRLILRPLTRTELVSVDVGWEQRAGDPAPVLVAPASVPLGRGIVCPLGLAPGPYEARQVAVEGRVDGPAGRLYIDARAPVPGLPVFEVRPGVLLDLGDMVCVISGGSARLLLGEQGGGDDRAPALAAVARSVVGPDPPIAERPLRTAGRRP